MFSHQTELHDLKAKIAELEQSATTVQQLEEMINHRLVVSLWRDKNGVTVGFSMGGCCRSAQVQDTLPAAIAAAYAAKEE